MVSEIDKRNRLGEEPFKYQKKKKGTVIIYYGGKQIKIVKDGKAAQLIEKLNTAYSNKAITVVWGILWGALFFSEPIKWNMILGAVIVIIGVITVVKADE